MQHIRYIVKRHESVRCRQRTPSARISWQRAAEEARAVARTRTADPATLKQLRRVCQLLTSRTVQENERRRAMLRLARGCTKRVASAMLDYFIPVVRARTPRRSTGIE